MHRHLLPSAARILKCKSYETIAPKDVRKTFANIAVAAGIDELVLQAYFGHAQYTTFRKNYARSDLISRFQSDVVLPLESHLRRVVTENARDVKDVERMVDSPLIKLIPDERDPLNILSGDI